LPISRADSSPDPGEDVAQSRDDKSQQALPAVTMTDVLGLPDRERELVSWIMRQGTVALPQVCAELAQDEPAALATLDGLIASGFLQTSEADGEQRYTVRVASRPVRRTGGRDLWKTLED
jgi:hypothetical protein